MSMKLMATSVMMASFLAGCATIESGRKFDTSAESRLEIGTTTVDNALAWFGQPTQITRNSDGGKILVYTHTVAHGNFTGHGSSEMETLGLNFGPDGKLRKFVTSGTPAQAK